MSLNHPQTEQAPSAHKAARQNSACVFTLSKDKAKGLRKGFGVKMLYIETRVKILRLKDFSWEYSFFVCRNKSENFKT